VAFLKKALPVFLVCGFAASLSAAPAPQQQQNATPPSQQQPGMLFLSSLVTPAKSGASILRNKPPWYRDSEHRSSIEPQD
jgi:hypothetical protein